MNYTEIVVRLVPPPTSALDALRSATSYSSASEPTRTYNALVYTDLDLPPLKHPDPPGGRAARPATVAGLPLASVEQVTVRWSRYQEYLALFVEGEKDPGRI